MTDIPFRGSVRLAGDRPVTRLLAATAFAVASAASGAANAAEHSIVVVNRCSEQIWLGERGSASSAPHHWALAPTCTDATAHICPSGTCQAGSCTCTSDADCRFGAPAGTTTAHCDTGAGRCVKRAKVSVPAGWQGRFWPRTQCSGSDTSFVCETGQCGPATGGNIDCTVQNAAGNLATLFEIATAGNNAADTFDVSLVSGYNVPVAVKVQLPADAPRWKPNTSYTSGAQIIARVGTNVFGFTNGGSAGTSGATKPAFPGTWTHSVGDGSDIVWVNTGPACEPSGCSGPIGEAQCPSVLRVSSGSGGYIACDAPANACSAPSSPCAADLDYYQCQNNGGETDLFGKVLTLESPNAGTFVCFSAKDCPAGTTCQLNPTFVDSGFQLPAGTGLCTPVAQNGGCTPSDDGKLCPAIHYPFVGYTCQTLSGKAENAQVCLPPITAGMGDLWWNAANWTEDASPPSCAQDSDCGGAKKCLAGPTHAGLKPCDGSCTCWSPKTCTAATCPGPDQCLNADGVPDGQSDGGTIVDCNIVTCYCGPQGIYSGACGPTNPSWLQAAAALGGGTAKWPERFKSACPTAYSYQFDDPSSVWSCPNPAQGLNRYRVTFCGRTP